MERRKGWITQMAAAAAGWNREMASATVPGAVQSWAGMWTQQGRSKRGCR